MKKLYAILSSSVMFGIFLLVVYWLHITFFKVDVVFYAALFDGVVAAVLTVLIVFFNKCFFSLLLSERALLFVIWLLLGYGFAISVPTVIDRSLSFYILEKIQQRGGGIKQDAMSRVFIEEYIPEHRLMDVRLTEQLESGTIEIKNGCVLLTKKGEIIASFGRFFRTNFLPKQRLLLGEYTDALTDPFRQRRDYTDYVCK
jgi:hypothetical protein